MTHNTDLSRRRFLASTGALAGCIVAVAWQPDLVRNFGDPEGAMAVWADSFWYSL